MNNHSGDRAVTIGSNLNRYREAKGLTQQAVLDAAGVSKASYTSYEAGRGMPSADKFVSLAHVLGTTTDELLLDPSEMVVSQDMVPILKRFEALPQEIRKKEKSERKGVMG